MWLALVLLLAPQETSQEEPQEKPRKPDKEVVIIGTRRESDVLDVPSGVTVITREQIEKSGASNIIEVLRGTPGFFPQGPNKGAVDALSDLRGYNNGGGNGQRTLVLVDGRRTNGVTNSSTDWASIPLDNIERIEIVRGPAAALYGDPALAGVVHIFTRKGEKKETAWRAHASGGSFDTLKGAAEVRGGSGAASFAFFGASESTDGWRENSRTEAVDLTGRLEYALDDAWTLHLKVGGHSDDRRRPGSLTESEIETLGRDATVTPGDKADRWEAYVDVAIVHASGALGEFSAQLTALRGEATALFTAFGDFEILDEFEQTGLFLKNVKDVELFGIKWKTTVGIDLIYEEANALSGSPGTFTDSDYLRQMAGVFGHVEARPLERLVVTASVRYDRALLDLDRDGPFVTPVDRERAFDQVSPALGATFHVLDELSLYAGYGRPFKYPTRDEVVGFFATDPELRPERAHSYEIGARLWSKRWGKAGAAYYRMDVKDEIFFDSSTFTNLNFEDVRHQGVEAELLFTPLAADSDVGLDLFATYTYTRAIIGSDGLEGKRYPVTPFHAGTTGVTARWKAAYVTLSGRLTGRRFLIDDVTNSGDMLPAYWVYDAKAGWRVGKVLLFATVFNVTDREYFDSGGLFGPKFNPGPERSFLVGFEAEF